MTLQFTFLWSEHSSPSLSLSVSLSQKQGDHCLQTKE